MSLPCGFVRGLPVGLQSDRPPLRGRHAAQRRASLSARHRLASRACRRACTRGGAAMMSWEIVIGLEIHAQLATRARSSPAPRRATAPRRTRRRASSISRCPGTLPVLNARGRAHGDQFGLAVGAHDLARARCSRARTTSIPTCRRAIRSASTSCRSCHGRAIDIVARRRRDKGVAHHARAPRGGRRQVAARGLRTA